jgi:hypothetical protein
VDKKGRSSAELLAEYEKVRKSHGATIRYGDAPGPFAGGGVLPGKKPQAQQAVVKKSEYRDKYEGPVNNLLKTVQQKKTFARLLDALDGGWSKNAQRELDALKNQVSKDGARPGIVGQMRNIEKDIAKLASGREREREKLIKQNKKDFPIGTEVSFIVHSINRSEEVTGKVTGHQGLSITVESPTHGSMVVESAKLKPARENDYGQVVVGDRVLINMPGGRSGSARDNAHGKSGEVVKVGPKNVTVRTDDGKEFLVSRGGVVKNNSGTKTPESVAPKQADLSKFTVEQLEAQLSRRSISPAYRARLEAELESRRGMSASVISTDASINLVLTPAVSNEMLNVATITKNPGFSITTMGKGRIIVIKDKKRTLDLIDNQIDIMDDQGNTSLKRALRALRKKIEEAS